MAKQIEKLTVECEMVIRRSQRGDPSAATSQPAAFKRWNYYLDVTGRLVFQLGTGLLKHDTAGDTTFFFTIL